MPNATPAVLTSKQLQEQVVEYLFLNPTPQAFYQIRAGLGLKKEKEADGKYMPILPTLTILRERGIVRRIVATKIRGSPRYTLEVHAWLKIAKERRAVGQRRSHPSGGREITGSTPVGPINSHD